jgi:hypothetical protein
VSYVLVARRSSLVVCHLCPSRCVSGVGGWVGGWCGRSGTQTPASGDAPRPLLPPQRLRLDFGEATIAYPMAVVSNGAFEPLELCAYDQARHAHGGKRRGKEGRREQRHEGKGLILLDGRGGKGSLEE